MSSDTDKCHQENVQHNSTPASCVADAFLKSEGSVEPVAEVSPDILWIVLQSGASLSWQAATIMYLTV